MATIEKKSGIGSTICPDVEYLETRFADSQNNPLPGYNFNKIETSGKLKFTDPKKLTQSGNAYLKQSLQFNHTGNPAAIINLCRQHIIARFTWSDGSIQTIGSKSNPAQIEMSRSNNQTSITIWCNEPI